MTTKAELKRELLDHYATHEPVLFGQLDGFFVPGSADDVLRPDADGDSLTAGHTHELMTGIYAVRVLITAGTTQRDAVRLLRKIADWVESDGLAALTDVGDCPRCGRITGRHHPLCEYFDGTPTELTDAEIQRVLAVLEKQGCKVEYLPTQGLPL
jgi:hypothetical protein